MIFTQEQLQDTFKSERAIVTFSKKFNNYVKDVADKFAKGLTVQEIFFAPNTFGDKLGLGLHVEVGYLTQYLIEATDQLPVDIMIVRGLLDKADYGLFDTDTFKNDLEVTFPEERISDDDDYMGAGILKGGRHRLSTILSVCSAAGVDINSEDFQNQLVRVIPSTFSQEHEVPTLQMLANTSRSMGVAEKAYGKAKRLDIDVDSPSELFTAMSKATSATMRTDLYRTLFSVCVIGDVPAGIKVNTMADIGSAFFTRVKKIAPKSMRQVYSFTSVNVEGELDAHLSLYSEIVEHLPQLLLEYEGQNIARSAREIGTKLAELVAL